MMRFNVLDLKDGKIKVMEVSNRLGRRILHEQMLEEWVDCCRMDMNWTKNGAD